MTRAWRDFDDEEIARMKRLFDRLSLLDALNDAAARPTTADDVARPRRLGPQQLYEIVLASDRSPSQEELAALENDPRAQADLKALIARSALAQFPRLAAAASHEAEVDRVSSSGSFVIRIRPTTRGRDEVYLIIETQSEALDLPTPRKIVVQRLSGAVAVLTLGEDRVRFPLQRILPADAPIIVGLKDVDATVNLV